MRIIPGNASYQFGTETTKKVPGDNSKSEIIILPGDQIAQLLVVRDRKTYMASGGCIHKSKQKRGSSGFGSTGGFWQRIN